jgi:putative endonuclease
MSSTPKNVRWGHRTSTLISRWWRSTRRRFIRHNSSGRWGERATRRFLETNGLIVLVSNWREKRLEADIIAVSGRTIVVVEVKTRNARFKSRFPAIGAITREKYEHLIALQRRFIRNNGPLCRRYALRKQRIDIVEVYYRRSRFVGRRIDEIRWHHDFIPQYACES